MKKLTFLFFGLIFSFFTSCNKEECEQKIATCSEEPPEGELCKAIYDRYFYNEEKNQCELINYTGCTQTGFDTKTECDACLCN